MLHDSLNDTPKIFVKDERFSDCKTANEFLSEFFRTRTPYTYDEKDRVQCGPNTGRSFGDLFGIVKTVFPETTPKQLAEELKDLSIKNEVSSLTCGTIRGVAFHDKHKYGYNIAIWTCALQRSEMYANTGAFSWQEIVMLINEQEE